LRKPFRKEKVPLSILRRKSLLERDRKSLLRLGYEPYLIVRGMEVPTLEGPYGSYLNQDDRRKHVCANMDSDGDEGVVGSDIHPAHSGSVFPCIPVAHAPYRETGEAAFARRIEEHRAKLALEEMRIPSTAMAFAVMECVTKGRRPSDVIGEQELCLNTLKSHVERVRTRVLGERPVNRRHYVARVPIAYKTIVIDGVEHTVKICPPKERNTRFAPITG
jgi:hypothetical protein